MLHGSCCSPLRERVTKPQPTPGFDPAEPAIINKDGIPTGEVQEATVPVEPEKPADEITKWMLRVPAEVMAPVEKGAKKAYAKKSINTWFGEAAV
ncbi:hypothetical protein SAE02_72950 [Skermanella aerolata]|uniref:Uncharacterized protein n=2 Tax=Skermanella aerolata TaxID=393310 RepID=A0A512E364_9PROT|nr:hypothetical protein SAE02_72950 [Skermanella aerolata]